MRLFPLRYGHDANNDNRSHNLLLVTSFESIYCSSIGIAIAATASNTTLVNSLLKPLGLPVVSVRSSLHSKPRALSFLPLSFASPLSFSPRVVLLRLLLEWPYTNRCARGNLKATRDAAFVKGEGKSGKWIEGEGKWNIERKGVRW